MYIIMVHLTYSRINDILYESTGNHRYSYKTIAVNNATVISINNPNIRKDVTAVINSLISISTDSNTNSTLIVDSGKMNTYTNGNIDPSSRKQMELQLVVSTSSVPTSSVPVNATSTHTTTLPSGATHTSTMTTYASNAQSSQAQNSQSNMLQSDDSLGQGHTIVSPTSNATAVDASGNPLLYIPETVQLDLQFDEGRLVCPINLEIDSKYYSTVSAVDFGSDVNLQLYTKDVPNTLCTDSTMPYTEGNSSGTDYRTGIICRSLDHINDMYLGLNSQRLGVSDLNGVIFVEDSTAIIKTHTGFSYGGPFLVFIQRNWQKKYMTLLVNQKKLLFTNNLDSSYFTIPWFSSHVHKGRCVKITSINGITTDLIFTIDTGNDSFFSYSATDFAKYPGLSISDIENKAKPLKICFNNTFCVEFAANQLRVAKPFLTEANTIDSTLGESLQDPMAFSHNVLALGFMSNLKLTFVDGFSNGIHLGSVYVDTTSENEHVSISKVV